MNDALTSELLVESIKRRASMPESQSTFTKEDFLAFANEEIRLGIVPSILSLHEDYLLFEIDIPIGNEQREFTIPSRAVGNKLRDVQHKLRNGSYVELVRGSIGDRFNDNSAIISNLRTYYVKNNKIILNSDLGNSLRGCITMVFYIKPSNLVDESRVGIIRGINRDTGEVTLGEVPDNFNTSAKYDFYKAESPHSILTIDIIPNTLNTTTDSITFDPELIPSDLEVGDHLALAGESIIPQIPNELQVMLAQMVACRVLEAQGDADGLRLALTKLQQMETAAGFIIDNRVDDSPKKIINRHGTVRTSTFSKRFNRR